MFMWVDVNVVLVFVCLLFIIIILKCLWKIIYGILFNWLVKFCKGSVFYLEI